MHRRAIFGCLADTYINLFIHLYIFTAVQNKDIEEEYNSRALPGPGKLISICP